MADVEDEKMVESNISLPEAGGRPPTDAKTCSWRTLAISVIVAVALSVTATLLLGGGWRFHGAGGCGGWAMSHCPGPGGEKAR